MAVRKSLNVDVDPVLAAFMAKVEKIKQDQREKLGDILILSNLHKRFRGDADRLLAGLIRFDEMLAANPGLLDGGTDGEATFPAGPDATASKSNGSGHADAESTRRRPADLLDGTAPGRAGHRSATEEPEDV